MQSRTPFSTEGMKLRGIAPPKMSSTNSKPAAPGERLDLEPGVAVLAAAARLLLVLALHLRAALDRLLVGDARRQEDDVDVVLALHPLDHDLDVELADARDQELLGLGVEVVVERGVFLGDAGRARWRSCPRRRGSSAGSRRRSPAPGTGCAGRITGCASSHSVSPVSVSLSFGTTPISPAPSASTFFCVLPWSQPTWPMRSRRLARRVETWESPVTTPEKTRKSESLPTWGSESVLNTSAENGAFGWRRASPPPWS